MPPIIPLVTKKKRQTKIRGGGSTFTATTASSSADLTVVSSFVGLEIGQVVAGAGIPAGATIITLDSGAAKVTLSAAATASASGVSLTASGSVSLKLRLGKVSRDLDDTVDIATLAAEECDFTDYPAGGLAVTMTAGYITPDRVPADESQLLEFQVVTPTVGNSVYYWWIDDGTDVILCEQFPSPVPMSIEGQTLKFVVFDGYNPAGVEMSQVLPAA